MLRKIFISLAFFALALAPTFAADTSSTDSTAEKSESRALELIGGEILPGSDFESENDSAEYLINSFFQKLTTLLIGTTATVAVIFLIIGGYQYLTSFGNEEQVKSAHKTILFSLVGVILAMLAFAIVQIVVNIKFEEVETTNNDAIQKDFEDINKEIEDNCICTPGETKNCSDLNTTWEGATSCKDDCSGWDESKCEKLDVGDVF